MKGNLKKKKHIIQFVGFVSYAKHRDFCLLPSRFDRCKPDESVMFLTPLYVWKHIETQLIFFLCNLYDKLFYIHMSVKSKGKMLCCGRNL